MKDAAVAVHAQMPLSDLSVVLDARLHSQETQEDFVREGSD